MLLLGMMMHAPHSGRSSLMRSVFATLFAQGLGLFVVTNSFAQAIPVPQNPPLLATVIPPMGVRPLVRSASDELAILDHNASMWGPAMRKRRWYGWQTLAVLVPVDVLSIVGIATQSKWGEQFVWSGAVPIHLLTGPIVNWSHGHGGRGFAALGLNVALPILGFTPGLATNSWKGLYTVMGLGLVVAHVIDLAMFSFDDLKVPTQSSNGESPLLPSSIALIPVFDAHKRGLALVGQF